MSKALTHETHYRARTGSHATKGSKRGANLLGWDTMEEEWLSATQERDAIKERVKQLHDLFRLHGKSMSPEERTRASLEFNRLNARLGEIRPRIGKLTRGLDLASFIIEVARERLSKPVFDDIYMEAVRRCEQHNAAFMAERKAA